MKYQGAVLAALFALVGACTQPAGNGQSVTSATTTQSATPAAVQASTNNEAPPMENGVYMSRALCSGEGGCPWKHWRASGPVEVRERADATSPVIATLAAGDWVEALDGFTRFVPRRGVVRTADQGLEVGDVVYLLDSEGEGDFSLWRRGEMRSWHWPDAASDEAFIQWDPVARDDGPTLGWWVRLKLADGRIGWVSNPRFECMGPIAGDDNCRG